MTIGTWIEQREMMGLPCFSIDEVRLAMTHGYEPISLGKSRLRTETAGLSAVMMANLTKRKL